MPPLTAAVLEALPHLRAIGCTRTEPVNINMGADGSGHPGVLRARPHACAAAELTVGLIIAETRNIGRGHQALAQGVRRRTDLHLLGVGAPVDGQTVGLIGGFRPYRQPTAGPLKPFGLRVLAYDPYVVDGARVRRSRR